jgi:hypothetical protein
MLSPVPTVDDRPSTLTEMPVIRGPDNVVKMATGALLPVVFTGVTGSKVTGAVGAVVPLVLPVDDEPVAVGELGEVVDDPPVLEVDPTVELEDPPADEDPPIDEPDDDPEDPLEDFDVDPVDPEVDPVDPVEVFDVVPAEEVEPDPVEGPLELLVDLPNR